MIRIRKIEGPNLYTDLEALFALDQICFRPGIAYSRDDLKYFLAQPGSLSFTVADDKNKLLGFAIVEVGFEVRGPVGHIVTIDVDPLQRRKGIGRALMQAMLDGLAAEGAVAVRLEVAVDNPDAQSFYRGFDFVPKGRKRRFYLGTVDAVVMERPVAMAVSAARANS